MYKLFFLLLFSFHLAAFNQKVFERMLKYSTPNWIKGQINEDLNPYTTELSHDEIENVFRKNISLLRMRVINGKISFEKNCEKNAPIISHLKTLHQLLPLPDIDILFSLEKMATLEMNHLPICITAKRKEDRGMILIPEKEALSGYQSDVQEIIQGNEEYPWERKKDLLFFSGKKQKIAQLPTELFQLSTDETPLSEYVSYKYHLDLGYNTSKFPLLLHSNSLIFKANTGYKQWFYNALMPDVHFILVREDLKDLASKLNFAKINTGISKLITEYARIFAEDVLSQEASYLYLYKLLCEYANRQEIYYSY